LLLLLYFKIPAASSLSYRGTLESLDKSPEMNNRCLICAMYCYCHHGQRT
jgi:hypothetical protein